MDAVREQPQGRLNALLRALRSRNYRLFFCGQLTSLVGTWLAQVAMSWLVYRLTGSKILLGTVAFATQIPGFCLGPWVGVLVDRWNLRRTLVVTQTLSMLQAFMVAGLTLAHVITPAQIVALALVLGIINAFDMPARQAFVIQMVERREDLPNAIALNSSMFNASRLIGPAAAGVLVAWVGEGVCFLLNGISFIAVILALLAMRLPPAAPRPAQRDALAEFREGFAYAFGSLPIRSLLINLGTISLLGSSHVVLMPVFAQDIYHGGPRTLGVLSASIGAGALVAGIGLAMRKSVIGLARLIAIGSTLLGVSLIAFSLSRSLWLSMPLLACCGVFMLCQMASSNTVLQTIVEDDKRGRVMALYGMAFLGMMPLGSLLAGTVAERWGAPATVAIGGGCCILSGLWFAYLLPRFREHVRPIYQRRGILPAPVADETPAAEER